MAEEGEFPICGVLGRECPWPPYLSPPILSDNSLYKLSLLYSEYEMKNLSEKAENVFDFGFDSDRKEPSEYYIAIYVYPLNSTTENFPNPKLASSIEIKKINFKWSNMDPRYTEEWLNADFITPGGKTLGYQRYYDNRFTFWARSGYLNNKRTRTEKNRHVLPYWKVKPADKDYPNEIDTEFLGADPKKNDIWIVNFYDVSYRYFLKEKQVQNWMEKDILIMALFNLGIEHKKCITFKKAWLKIRKKIKEIYNI